MPLNVFLRPVIYMLLSLIHFPTFCSPIGEQIDSLQSLLRQKTAPEEKVAIYNELAWLLRKKQTDSAIYYANAAVQLAKKTGNTRGQGNGYLRMGEIKRLQKQYTTAADYFIKALEKEKMLRDKYGIARAYYQMTLCYKGANEPANANESIANAIQVLKETEHLSLLARAYHQRALINESLNRHDVAIMALEDKVVISEKLQDPELTATTMSFLGNLYDQHGSLDQAKNVYHKAFDIWDSLGDIRQWAKTATDLSAVYINDEDFQTAIDLINKSIQICDSLNIMEILAANYNNLGVIAEKQGNIATAKKFYLQCIAIKEKLPSIHSICLNHYNIGNLYEKLAKWDSAIYHYRRSLELNSYEMSLQMKAYWDIVQLFLKLNQTDSTLRYLANYGVLRDSTDRMLAASSRAKDNFEQALKEKEILERDNHIQRVSLEKQTQMIIGLIIILFLFIGIGILYFRSYRLKQRSLLAEKETEIKDKEIEDLLNTHEIKLLDEREEERTRIARDLHDRLGGTLSVVKIHMKSVEDILAKGNSKSLESYKKASLLLDDACEEVRQVAHDLESGVLKNFGLVSALRSLMKTVNATGQLRLEIINFGFEDENEPARLKSVIERPLYRIIQELLSNVLKHADAKEMTVQLLKKNDNLNVVVEDDGIGFDPSKTKKEGLGLRSIQSRIEKLNAFINLDSGKGSGTTITIDIPLQS